MSDATASVCPSILIHLSQPCQLQGHRFKTQPRSSYPPPHPRVHPEHRTGSPLVPASTPGLASPASPTPLAHTRTHTHASVLPYYLLWALCCTCVSPCVIHGLLHVCNQMLKPPVPPQPAPFTRTRERYQPSSALMPADPSRLGETQLLQVPGSQNRCKGLLDVRILGLKKNPKICPHQSPTKSSKSWLQSKETSEQSWSQVGAGAEDSGSWLPPRSCWGPDPFFQSARQE